MKSTKSTKKALSFFMALCMVLTMVGGFGTPESVFAVLVEPPYNFSDGLTTNVRLDDGDTDRVYFAGDTLQLSVSNASITTSAQYLIVFGIVSESGTSTAAVINSCVTDTSVVLSGGAFAFGTTASAINYVSTSALNVSDKMITFSGIINSGLSNGAIVIGLYVTDGGITGEWQGISGPVVFQESNGITPAGIGATSTTWSALVGLDQFLGTYSTSPSITTPFAVRNSSGQAISNTENNLYDTKAVFSAKIGNDTGTIEFLDGINFMDQDFMTGLASSLSNFNMTYSAATAKWTMGIKDSNDTGYTSATALTTTAILSTTSALVSLESSAFAGKTAADFDIDEEVAGGLSLSSIQVNGNVLSFRVNHFSDYTIGFRATTTPSSGGGGSSGTLYYNVMFHTDGGSLINIERVASGQKAYKPVDPSKAGFAFAGWYADKELTTPFDFTKEINSNTWVYAKWTPSTAPQIVLKFNIGQITSYFKSGNAAEVSKPLDAAPFLKGNRTFLPIRFVVEPLGGTITWNQDDQKVTITKGTTTIELWIGNNVAKINGKQVQIDAANPDVKPMIVNPGRTMLPLRFISEALGCTVEWDQLTYQVTVKN